MKTQLKGLLFILFSLFLINRINSQNLNNSIPLLTKTSEKIIEYKFENPPQKYSLKPIGYIDKNVIYQFVDYSDWSIKFYTLNEIEYTFHQVLNEISFKGRDLYFFSVSDSIIFYRKRFSNIENEGKCKLIIQQKNNVYMLDSIDNADKRIHSSFSTNGNILIVNTLNTLSDYYNTEQDNRFMIYRLDSINKGKIIKDYIPCIFCADGYLVGNELFFTRSNLRDDFSNGFAWKNIYKAPWGKLQDSLKIAVFSEILVISPDGKYILATRHFDLPNNPCVIIDVERKRYQLLFGRNYSKATAFYSYKEKKFAFDFGGKIVYVDFPNEYPFDALRRDNQDIPKWSNKDFYKQLEHEPF